MFYTNYQFLLPGDELISEQENRNFHRGVRYKIKHVLHDKGKLVYVVEDKWSEGITIRYGNEFSHPAKLVTASLKRRLIARFSHIWQTSTSFISASDSEDYDWRYRIHTSHFYSGQGEHYETSVSVDKITRDKKWRHTPLNVPTINGKFKSKEDFVDFFVKETTRQEALQNYHYNYNFVIVKNAAKEQGNLDVLAFIAEYNILPVEENHLTLYPHTIVRDYPGNKAEFFEKLAQTAFDVKDWEDTTKANKELTKDIMNLFKKLPGQHGPTSVSKILCGTGKKVANVEDFWGKYKGIYSQILLFELAQDINNHSKTMKESTEDYWEGEEWN